MAWDFLNRYLGNEPEEDAVSPSPAEKPTQPPTPFYISHVPDQNAMAMSDEPRAYLMDPTTKRKRSEATEVEVRGKYPASMLNVGVGPFPKVRPWSQVNPKKLKLAKR